MAAPAMAAVAAIPAGPKVVAISPTAAPMGPKDPVTPSTREVPILLPAVVKSPPDIEPDNPDPSLDLKSPSMPDMAAVAWLFA